MLKSKTEKGFKDYKLNNEEKELINSIESGEWVSVGNLQEEIKKHRQITKKHP